MGGMAGMGIQAVRDLRDHPVRLVQLVHLASMEVGWPTSAGGGPLELVYDGLTAGSWYQHTGGGANYICAVKNAKYHLGATTVNRGYSQLYGAEYEAWGGQALEGIISQNIPCAVCEVSTRSKHLMVPGTYQCPTGWTQEYSGWLMSANKGHKGRTMFVCLDKDPEAIPGHQHHTNGALMYPVEAECTVGLPCGPYDNRKELSCVVCTK